MPKKSDQIEDIFDEVEKSSTPDKNKRPNKVNAAQSPAAQTTVSPKVGPASAGSNPVSPKSKLPLLVLIVFVIIVLSGIVYLVFTGTLSDFFAGDENQSATINDNSVSSDDPMNADDNGMTNNSTGNTININDIDIGEPDADGDGLSDAEEASLGTNPDLVDSDNDQLFDRIEVEVYETEPLNPDTDGDGQLDGVEVKNGYDPNGPGVLLDLQKEINNLEN